MISHASIGSISKASQWPYSLLDFASSLCVEIINIMRIIPKRRILKTLSNHSSDTEPCLSILHRLASGKRQHSANDQDDAH